MVSLYFPLMIPGVNPHVVLLVVPVLSSLMVLLVMLLENLLAYAAVYPVLVVALVTVCRL